MKSAGIGADGTDLCPGRDSAGYPWPDDAKHHGPVDVRMAPGEGLAAVLPGEAKRRPLRTGEAPYVLVRGVF
jgi:hypothetical protein